MSLDVFPGKPAPTRTWPLPGILALAFALRLIPFFMALPAPERFYTLDARGYMGLAADLQAGYFEPDSPQWPMGFVRTPGYPVFAGIVLTLSGGSIPALILAQLGLSLLSIVLTHRLCGALFGLQAATIAALALALDPATIVYTNLLQPESMFIATLLPCLMLWIKALRDFHVPAALATGALAGIATLVRPIGILLPVPLLVIAVFSPGAGRRKAFLFCAAIASSSLFVGGWMVRNASYTGVPFLSSIEGVNFLYYRAAGALANEQNRDMEEVRQELAKKLEHRLGPERNPGVVSQVQSRLGMEVLKDHPMGALRSAASGILHLAAGTGLTALSGLRGDPEPERVSGWAEQAIQTLFAFFLGSLYVAASIGAWKLTRARDFMGLAVLVSFIFYFAVMSAGPEATTRFRVPIAPFLAMLAGAGLSRPTLQATRPASTA